MLVSVISINYNNCEGLRKTIQSVAAQNFRDYEHIVIDGGSSDNSLDVINEYNNKLRYWVSEPDRGVYNAQNKGILQANGLYVLFLNSGDYFITNQALSVLINGGEEKDIIYGDIIYKSNFGEVFHGYPDKLDFSFFLTDTLPHPCTLIKRKLFLEYGLYREEIKISADWAFFLDVISKGTVTYKHIGEKISAFELGGLSSGEGKDSIIQGEREDYVRRHYDFFWEGYNRLRKYEEKIWFLRRSRLFRMFANLLPPRFRKVIYE